MARDDGASAHTRAVDTDATDPTWQRLEAQIAWYDAKSGHAQRWYKRIKLIELIAAAAVPAIAGPGGPLWLVTTLGSLVVVLEAAQHLYQFHEQWIAYRSTCEALRHERYLYLARAGPYSTARTPHALLAERIESLVSQEHAKWASGQEEAARRSDVQEAVVG